MVQKVTKKNAALFLLMGIFMVGLIVGACLLVRKPELILQVKELFLTYIILISAFVLLSKLGMLVKDIKDKLEHKDWTKNKELKREFGLTLLQCFLGISFGASGIILAALAWTNTIAPNKAMLGLQVLCGIFAAAAIGAIVCSLVANFTGYFYVKNKLIDDERNQFFDSVKNKENSTINKLNILNNIANVLLSFNLCTCNIFSNLKYFLANQIFYDNGMRRENVKRKPKDSKCSINNLFRKENNAESNSNTQSEENFGANEKSSKPKNKKVHHPEKEGIGFNILGITLFCMKICKLAE